MKAQMFSLDLILGLLITIATITSVVLFLPNNTPPFTQELERAQALMTEGYPTNWNNTTVIMPGFLSSNRFNTTKIQLFANFSVDKQRDLLGFQSDFTIRFRMNNTLLSLCNTCGAVPTRYASALRVERYGLIGSNITTMEVTLYR